MMTSKYFLVHNNEQLLQFVSKQESDAVKVENATSGYVEYSVVQVREKIEDIRCAMCESVHAYYYVIVSHVLLAFHSDGEKRPT